MIGYYRVLLGGHLSVDPARNAPLLVGKLVVRLFLNYKKT